MPNDHDPRAKAIYDEQIFSTPDIVDGRRLELHAERLIAETVRVEDAVVVIRKRVITERQTFEVELRREELVIERIQGDGRACSGEEPSETKIFLYAEKVELRKSVVPVEEVRFTKKPVVEIRTVSGTARREVLDVPSILSQ